MKATHSTFTLSMKATHSTFTVSMKNNINCKMAAALMYVDANNLNDCSDSVHILPSDGEKFFETSNNPISSNINRLIFVDN